MVKPGSPGYTNNRSLNSNSCSHKTVDYLDCRFHSSISREWISSTEGVSGMPDSETKNADQLSRTKRDIFWLSCLRIFESVLKLLVTEFVLVIIGSNSQCSRLRRSRAPNNYAITSLKRSRIPQNRANPFRLPQIQSQSRSSKLVSGNRLDHCQAVIWTEIEVSGIKWVGIIASVRLCAVDGLQERPDRYYSQDRHLPKAGPGTIPYDANSRDSFKGG